jgi:hypothetical protein
MRNYIDVSKILELREKNYTNIQIAKALKYGEHTISKYLKLNGIKPFNKRSFIKMTNYQKEVLVGTLLGDACIKYGANTICPQISIVHTIKQKEFLLKKAEIFESLKCKVGTGIYKNYFTKGISEIIYYRSFYFDELIEWHKAFYTPIKIINKEYVEKWFTDVSLAYLFMDDGHKDGLGVGLNLQSFTYEDLAWFRDFLIRKFDIKFSLVQTKGKYFMLRLSHKSSSKFAAIVERHMTSDTLYKLDGCKIKQAQEFEKLKVEYGY